MKMTNIQKIRKAERRGFVGQAQAVFAEFSAAKSAAAALASHRRPSSNDLVTLGINAKSFNRIRFD
jgi:hypothetical protein